jgi:hypothetical protein
MIGIEDIEHKLRYEVKFGQSMPEFAFVNPAVINNIFYEGISAGHIPNSHYGFNGFALWTSVGRLELLPLNCLSDHEVVLSCSRNIALDILNKLGLNYDKNTIHR